MRTHSIIALAIFSVSILLSGSCGIEPGNWTIVNQNGNYIYGIWKSPTVKIASQAMKEIVQNIEAQGAHISSLQPLTTVPPESLLPLKVSVGRGATTSEWVQSRTPSTYHGVQSLYKDRAVKRSLYFAYGFKQQAEVEYEASRFGAKPLILLEIFDMGTPENAFGIYSFNTYPKAEIEWVGSKALLSGRYLRFSKGKYFIQIEGYEFATGIRDGMIKLANFVDDNIKEPPTKVPLLAILPSKRIHGSEKLFRTNWTLHQIYSGLPSHLPQFTNTLISDELADMDSAILNQDAPLMEVSAETPIGISARYNTTGNANWLNTPIVFIIRFRDFATAESVYAFYRDAMAAKNASIKMGVDGEVLINED